MAGPSGVGKSTASSRLPSPWRSLCDDATLVVRDGTGRLWAHPWPTWSRFFFDGPGGSWPVEHAVPLRAIFFLAQSPSDKLEQVNATQGAALTLESAKALVMGSYGMTGEEAASMLCTDGVRSAWGLALSVPAYSLNLNLDGRFWELIEHVLPTGDAFEAPAGKTGDEGLTTAVTLAARDALRLVYTGTSMSPTFRARDLLEIRPYGTRRVHPGDIVCFKSPEADMTVIHRVVAVERRRTEDGRPREVIRTRGDNNRQTDAWVLQPEDIIGRVAAVQRGSRRKMVPGAWRGLLVLRLARLGRSTRKRTGLLPHALYRLVVGLGPFDYLLPKSRRPRVVRFDARYQVFLKILSGGQTVGQWSDRLEEWRIRHPFHLFVNEQSLPCPKSLVK
jgi:signal peptidase I